MLAASSKLSTRAQAIPLDVDYLVVAGGGAGGGGGGGVRSGRKTLTSANSLTVVVGAGGIAPAEAGDGGSAPDGINWTRRFINNINTTWSSIRLAASPNEFVAIAIGNGWSYSFRSTNGINWTVRKMSRSLLLTRLTYDGYYFIGYSHVNPNVALHVSRNGLSWSQRGFTSNLGGQIASITRSGVDSKFNVLHINQSGSNFRYLLNEVNYNKLRVTAPDLNNLNSGTSVPFNIYSLKVA